ncbi:MAG: CopD family protein [Xanthomonadales bacterium]|nr:hypothetical protein [Xanthomonadales bacterium]MCC6594338.1 CopD family protein [Xanthomonadales bacterium]MCE7931385.1 CopD family protein [Xanthomonadales bacterium PRO6]
MDHLWVKTLHILFVIAWMAAVFYLPRILVNIAEAGHEPAVRERLLLMARRLYGFGHIMFGAMLLFGATLWLHYKIGGPWMHVKLSLVALILFFYIACGKMMKKAAAGGTLPSGKALRWFNEIPLLLAIPAIYLAVAKTLG